MSETNSIQTTWNQIHRGDSDWKHPSDEVVHFSKQALVCASSGDLVLDAGCGKGRHIRYLTGLGFQVVACDFSLTALQEADQRPVQANFLPQLQVADLEALPYAANQFRGALCVQVLPYLNLSQIQAAVKELRRVLLTDAWLYADLLDITDVEYGLGQEIAEHTYLDLRAIPRHFSPRHEIAELFRKFGDVKVTALRRQNAGRTRRGWIVWARK